VSDDGTVARHIVALTPNSPLDYHFWNELKTVGVEKPERTFSVLQVNTRA
jgi:hypothetical protein